MENYYHYYLQLLYSVCYVLSTYRFKCQYWYHYSNKYYNQFTQSKNLPYCFLFLPLYDDLFH